MSELTPATPREQRDIRVALHRARTRDGASPAPQERDDERPWHCPLCGARFSDPGDHALHLDGLDAERPDCPRTDLERIAARRTATRIRTLRWTVDHSPW